MQFMCKRLSLVPSEPFDYASSLTGLADKFSESRTVSEVELLQNVAMEVDSADESSSAEWDGNEGENVFETSLLRGSA